MLVTMTIVVCKVQEACLLAMEVLLAAEVGPSLYAVIGGELK